MLKLDMRTRNGLESTLLMIINESDGFINTFCFTQSQKWAHAICRLEISGTVRRVPNDQTCFPRARYTIHKPDAPDFIIPDVYTQKQDDEEPFDMWDAGEKNKVFTFPR
jgi:hypothetical protein